jgi:hypothetical protein
MDKNFLDGHDGLLRVSSEKTSGGASAQLRLRGNRGVESLFSARRPERRPYSRPARTFRQLQQVLLSQRIEIDDFATFVLITIHV